HVPIPPAPAKLIEKSSSKDPPARDVPTKANPSLAVPPNDICHKDIPSGIVISPRVSRGRGRGRHASAPEPRAPGKETSKKPNATQRARNPTQNPIEVIVSDPVADEETWSDVVRRKRPKNPPPRLDLRSTASKPTIRGLSGTNSSTRFLRGVKSESGITLYLENIEICEGETNEDIKHQVSAYAKNQNIRIMQSYVVHNKVSQYRVGCKIIVP
ncbi:unnamed protein product, partial [Owenia fusiformis]